MTEFQIIKESKVFLKDGVAHSEVRVSFPRICTERPVEKQNQSRIKTRDNKRGEDRATAHSDKQNEKHSHKSKKQRRKKSGDKGERAHSGKHEKERGFELINSFYRACADGATALASGALFEHALSEFSSDAQTSKRFTHKRYKVILECKVFPCDEKYFSVLRELSIFRGGKLIGSKRSGEVFILQSGKFCPPFLLTEKKLLRKELDALGIKGLGADTSSCHIDTQCAFFAKSKSGGYIKVPLKRTGTG